MRFRIATVASLVLLLLTVSPQSAWAAKFHGGTTNDVIAGTSGKDRMTTGGGSDTVFGRQGRDKITVQSSAANVVLVFPGSGRDHVVGGRGKNFIYDDDGTRGDVLIGGPSADVIFSADGARDTIKCGKGDDLAVVDAQDKVSKCENVIRSSLAGLAGSSDFAFGTSGNDTLALSGAHYAMGGPGNDQINGTNASETLLGGGGVDTLNGSGGDDTLIDDDGTPGDTLSPGTGGDLVYSADGAVDSIDCGGTNFETLLVDQFDNVTNCPAAFVVSAPAGGGVL